jgi:hypothetical protein
MRINIPGLGFIVLLVIGALGRAQVQPDANGRMSNLSRDLVENVQKYIADHHESPEDYLVRQFAIHDIIFLGEMHGVRQNLEFLQHLLPRLHAAGVYNLGYEFSIYKDQPKIDRLLASTSYDPSIANDLLDGIDLTYVTQEYTDVYRAAWELNRKLPQGAHHFRIVALNLDESGQASDAWGGQQLNIHDQANIFWSQVISKEFLAKHEKALIYSGSGHAYTRFFYQRRQDHSISAGNLIHNVIRDRTMTILLHGDGDRKDLTRQIDELVETGTGARPSGFDTRDTPLGTLPIPGNGYLFGKQNCGPFALGDVADGYIWLGRRTDLTGVRFIKGFITRENIARIEPRWRREHPRDRAYTKEEMEEAAADNWRHLQDVFK